MLTRLVHHDIDRRGDARPTEPSVAAIVLAGPGWWCIFVLTMAFFFDDTYEEVIRKLVDGLRFLRCWDEDWRVPASLGAVPGPRPV